MTAIVRVQKRRRGRLSGLSILGFTQSKISCASEIQQTKHASPTQGGHPGQTHGLKMSLTALYIHSPMFPDFIETLYLSSIYHVLGAVLSYGPASKHEDRKCINPDLHFVLLAQLADKGG